MDRVIREQPLTGQDKHATEDTAEATSRTHLNAEATTEADYYTGLLNHWLGDVAEATSRAIVIPCQTHLIAEDTINLAEADHHSAGPTRSWPQQLQGTDHTIIAAAATSQNILPPPKPLKEECFKEVMKKTDEGRMGDVVYMDFNKVFDKVLQ
eukprot:g30674.t1